MDPAGVQETGFWFVFHHVPTGPSEGLYSPGQTEHTPMGKFTNNRAHSNYRAGMILDNGVKTTQANNKDKRPFLSLIGARNDWINVGLCYPQSTTFTVVSDIHNHLTKQTPKTGIFMSTTQMEKINHSHLARGYFYWEEDTGSTTSSRDAAGETACADLCFPTQPTTKPSGL
ncbi:uncharacterized protein cemip [Spinachia spinachia]